MEKGARNLHILDLPAMGKKHSYQSTSKVVYHTVRVQYGKLTSFLSPAHIPDDFKHPCGHALIIICILCVSHIM